MLLLNARNVTISIFKYVYTLSLCLYSSFILAANRMPNSFFKHDPSHHVLYTHIISCSTDPIEMITATVEINREKNRNFRSNPIEYVKNSDFHYVFVLCFFLLEKKIVLIDWISDHRICIRTCLWVNERKKLGLYVLAK